MHVAGRSRNCLLTHRPTSVEPARSCAPRAAPARSAASSAERARRVEAVVRCPAARRSRRCSSRAALASAATTGAVSSARGGQVEHALAGVEDRPVAGAAAQVAGELVGELLARRPRAAALVVLVGRPQRHHEARRAEAALRAVALDHRLLHRMQRASLRRSPCRSSTVNSALPSSVGRNWMQALTVVQAQAATTAPASRRRRPARRSRRCRRRNRLRCSLPWCRCSARPRAASRARCGSARTSPTSTTAPRWKKRMGWVLGVMLVLVEGTRLSRSKIGPTGSYSFRAPYAYMRAHIGYVGVGMEGVG